MSSESYTRSKPQESEQALNFDQRENPGSYRSSRRDNRLPGEPKPRLPEATRAFVQRAFAHGVVEKIDGEKKLENPKKQEQWERRKWLLVRHVVEDSLTLEELKKYAGVTTRERARKLYITALTTIWEASPSELQRQFPAEEVLVGKKSKAPGQAKLREETKLKISASLRASEAAILHRILVLHPSLRGKAHSVEARANMSRAHKGKSLPPEHRANIAEAIRQKWEVRKATKKD